MANTDLTLPNSNVPVAQDKDGTVRLQMTSEYYRKFAEWLQRTNDNTVGGRLSFTATSNTNVRISYVGDDGTTRTADITLS